MPAVLVRRFSKRPSSQFDGLTDVTPSSTALAAQMRFNRFDPARQGFIQGDCASLAVQGSRSCSCASQPFCLSFHNLLGDKLHASHARRSQTCCLISVSYDHSIPAGEGVRCIAEWVWSSFHMRAASEREHAALAQKLLDQMAAPGAYSLIAT